MSYTYDISTNRGVVRREINDTDTANGKFTDAEIDYALTAGGSVGAAVVLCLEWLLAMLTDPNFTADWLTVDTASAYKSVAALLDRKRAQYSLAAVRATTAYTWRPDSAQTEAPTFDSTEDV